MNATIATVESGTLGLVLIILSTVLLCTLIALTYIYVRFHNILDKQEASLQLIQSDLSAICNGAVGVGQHLARLEQKIKSVTTQLDKLEMHEAPEISYKQAIKMVRSGANVDQIMTDCGLARGEAELVLFSKTIDQVN